MKGRSHRLASTEPPDDWVNGSWTVDCVCGVNFDDGKEMVNCDECGVWVHTRCSRFVKGQASFSCDKCKSKKNKNDNEETEVAQFLVELTSKTLRMDNLSAPSVPPRPAFRLWTEIPIEERVHVQGVPGGDPSLFQGLSSVFTSELWKCRGNIPKKFNFQYREFPCWDEKEEMVDARIEEEMDTPADRGGADVLFSLSKEIVLTKPAEGDTSLRGSTDEADCGRKIYSKEVKKSGGNDKSISLEADAKQEKTYPYTPFVNTGKQKEELLRSKERSKRARSTDKETDSKKKASTVGERKVEFYSNGGVEVDETDFHDVKIELKAEAKSTEPFDCLLDVAGNSEKSKEMSVARVLATECFSYKAEKNNVLSGSGVKSEKVNQESPTSVGCSPKSVAVSCETSASLTNKEEVNMAVNGLNHLKDGNHNQDSNGSSSAVIEDSGKLKPHVKDPHTAITDVVDNQDGFPSPVQQDKKVKYDVSDEQPREDLASFPFASHRDVKLESAKHLGSRTGISANTKPLEKVQIQNRAANVLPCPDDEAQKGNREAEIVGPCDMNKIIEGQISISGDLHQHGRKLDDAVDPISGKDGKPDSSNAGEQSESGEMSPIPNTIPVQGKVVSDVGKSSTAPTIVFSRSSSSSKNSATKAFQNVPRATYSSKQRVKTNSHAEAKKDHSMIDVIKDKKIPETQRMTGKEHTKVYSSSGLKAPQTSKISQASIPSRMVSESKEQALHPSSKTYVTHKVEAISSSVEAGGSLQTTSSSHVQNKTSLGYFQKGERVTESNSQPSSKVNHSPSMHPPAPVNSSATLSDEELALLLHQELNSSPRVPRVPRVRHVGSVSQLGSPTATSTLIKRTSSGAKDQIMFSRRKRDDATRGGSRNPSEPTEEMKRRERSTSCSDHGRRDPVSVNGSGKEESCNGSADSIPAKKNGLSPSTHNAIEGPPSSAEASDQNLSSNRSSSKDISDDDTGAVLRLPRTLPGLLDEIMSKGKRMSYEELCNAVLPHWPKLRKHNGERYAYTSHSQAVLDCLRNRNEWAQLVDRGPKTNARKRRKSDSESPIVEGISTEYEKSNTLQEVEVKYVDSQREDFPKGKRKARKRRRLVLQGRDIKDVRKRQKADALTDSELGSFSHSSEGGTENIFSEDESQGERNGTDAASSSSDEMGSML